MNTLDFLIRYLLKERKEDMEVPSSEEEKQRLYKALVNLREPGPLNEEYIIKSREYLLSKLNEKGIVKINDIDIIKDNISIWKGDITRLEVDAIINPANSEGLGCFNPSHVCLDNIIGVNAGLEIRNECNEIMKKKNYHLNNGEAFITKGYNLPCRYVIHTVAPNTNGTIDEKDINELSLCYKNSLDISIKNNIKTIAFPCIGTGIFSFPKDEACKIAINTILEYIKNTDYKFDRIIFCTYTDEDYNLYKGEIE